MRLEIKNSNLALSSDGFFLVFEEAGEVVGVEGAVVFVFVLVRLSLMFLSLLLFFVCCCLFVFRHTHLL